MHVRRLPCAFLYRAAALNAATTYTTQRLFNTAQAHGPDGETAAALHLDEVGTRKLLTATVSDARGANVE